MKARNKICLAALRSIGAMGIALALSACDNTSQSSTPTTEPTVAAATTQPADPAAVMAAYPARPPAIFTIDGQNVAFPAARLAVINHRGGLTLRLFSDDPPTAIDPGYVGNSFSFDMRMAIDRAEDIPACTWDHKPDDADDSVSGVFVHGFRDGLRPYDVHITFQKTDEQMLAYVDGTFLRNDNQNPAAPPDRVHVSACLHVSAVE